MDPEARYPPLELLKLVFINDEFMSELIDVFHVLQLSLFAEDWSDETLCTTSSLSPSWEGRRDPAKDVRWELVGL